jgi:hypothetical protein
MTARSEEPQIGHQNPREVDDAGLEDVSIPAGTVRRHAKALVIFWRSGVSYGYPGRTMWRSWWRRAVTSAAVTAVRKKATARP